MSKPREWRNKRDLKYHDSIQRIVSDTARPLLERVCVHELAEGEPEPKTDVGSGDSWT